MCVCSLFLFRCILHRKKNKQQQQNFYFIVLRCLVFMFSSFSFFLPLVFMADICVDLRNDLCCNFSFTISSLPKNKNIVFLSYVEYRFFFMYKKPEVNLCTFFFGFMILTWHKHFFIFSFSPFWFLATLLYMYVVWFFFLCSIWEKSV